MQGDTFAALSLTQSLSQKVSPISIHFSLNLINHLSLSCSSSSAHSAPHIADCIMMPMLERRSS